MAINLIKGQRVELDSGLSRLKVEMGWSLSNNARYDLDASTFLLGDSGQIENEYDFVFYGSPNKTEAKGEDGHTIIDKEGKIVYRPISLDKSVLGSIDDLGDDEDDTGEGSGKLMLTLQKRHLKLKKSFSL